MDLTDFIGSEAFKVKPIEKCWVISQGLNGGCLLVFDLRLLCYEMNFVYKEVMAIMGTFKMYKGKWWFYETPNPRLKDLPDYKPNNLKKYTIDLGVTNLIKDHFEQKN